jgi:copper chaperone NosL
LVVAASLLLVLAFFFPIWHISLSAPQYPEGKGLYIWANKITGELPHDLQIINELNHYIGMKRITPASIKELKIIPAVLAFLSLTGLAVGLKGNRRLLLGWLVLFALAGALGLCDFYSWEYDYGHNLDHNAPIQVPGMTYQPPLIGSKQLLNINALSMPYIGGYAVFGSAFLAGLGYLLERKRSNRR